MDIVEINIPVQKNGNVRFVNIFLSICTFNQNNAFFVVALKKAATNQSPDGQSKPEKTADELKDEGNECVRKGQFAEAILHYSFAIKLNPDNPILYSNRSLAFLKMKQLYYANEDAEKCIQLDSNWAKVRIHFSEICIKFKNKIEICRDIFVKQKFKQKPVNMIRLCCPMAALSNYSRTT